MKLTQIQKLYLSNFLAGLVFWYGIEKLFMRSIGINAVGIAAATAALTIFLAMFDIPAGILADKRSRKGVLVLQSSLIANLWSEGYSGPTSHHYAVKLEEARRYKSQHAEYRTRPIGQISILLA